MNWIKIVGSGLSGTTAMTLFSYLASEVEKEQFREPQLLGAMMAPSGPGWRRPKNQAYLSGGYLAHFAVGVLFVAGYDLLWQKHIGRPDAKNALLLGAVNGLVGAGVWRTVLALHPRPPRISVRRFLGHIILAHGVFGLAATETYRQMSRKHQV
ncbi:MAG: hypothetical protein HC880_07980 [Bacteroidia bacterium]|nr:hypothetical protein [Bacteroidia bacterium]